MKLLILYQKNKIILFLMKHGIFFICFFLLFLLLARNPFSLRTLIPVMDPFPDSIHYTNSVFSLIHGKGFVVEREGLSIHADVPPLYSFTLLPFFIIFNDVRSFYFANVLLSIISFILFYRIVATSFSRKRVQLLVLLSYLFCLPLSWYTTLPMAENLILPLFLLALNLMIDKYTFKKSLLMACVCVSFYATKYASIPLLFAFAFLYLIKIWTESKNRNKSLTYFILVLGILTVVFELFEYLSKGTGIITQLVPLFLKVFVAHQTTKSPGELTPQNVFFSIEFIPRNIRSYISWMLGGVIYVLWMPTRILSPVWAIPSFIGLCLAFTQKKWQWLVSSLIVSWIAVLLFMMSFYTTDGRYFWNAIPMVFLSFGFFLSLLLEFLNKKFSYIVGTVVFLIIGGIILVQNLSPVKSAVMLNLRHAETPWPYISILRLDDYLRAQNYSKQGMVPVVITPLSPYYVDFFRKEKMTLLPLDQKQEARADQTKVWGKYDYSHLHKVYTDFIKQGIPVYFASYGIGNDQDLRNSREALSTDFKLTEVDSGCLNVCNLYKLDLKN